MAIPQVPEDEESEGSPDSVAKPPPGWQMGPSKSLRGFHRLEDKQLPVRPYLYDISTSSK
jgi:hypothetical protein